MVIKMIIKDTGIVMIPIMTIAIIVIGENLHLVNHPSDDRILKNI